MRKAFLFRTLTAAGLGLFFAFGAGGCDTGVTTEIPPVNECDSCPAAANAQPACVDGHCGFTCDPGFADLDGNSANGCEFDLDTDPPGSTYTNIGSVSGDAGEDVVINNGVGEHWYRVYVSETNNGCIPLSVTIQLTPGAGTDYDLYVYDGNFSTQVGSSANGGTMPDEVTAAWDDECFMGIPTPTDQSRYLYIFVKFFSGNNGNNYTLSVFGNT